MGSSSERNQLLQLFNSHKKDIYEAFEVYEKPSDPSLVKLCWDKVLEMGDAISRQATIVGMIWTGEPPLYEEVEENMGAYVNTLNGFLLIAYGASIGAGPTLLNSIRSSVKKVLDTSFNIMRESIASFGSCSENDRTIPQLAGQVWEACSELERTPSTNIAAIGRRITKVAVSIKDVLRELNDLKAGPAKEDFDAGSESDSDGGADLGNDLSPEEMRVAREAISTVSGIMSVIKELLRAITAQKSRGDEPGFVGSLEKILTECRAMGPTVDELGACLYPPQETEAMSAALDKISLALGNVEAELESLAGAASEGFRQTCGDLKKSISRFRAELDRSEEVEEKLQGVELK